MKSFRYYGMRDKDFKIEIGDLLYGPNNHKYYVTEVREDGSFTAEIDEATEGFPDKIDMKDAEIKYYWVDPKEVYERYSEDEN